MLAGSMYTSFLVHFIIRIKFVISLLDRKLAIINVYYYYYYLAAAWKRVDWTPDILNFVGRIGQGCFCNLTHCLATDRAAM